MNGDDAYMSFLKAQDALTSTEGVLEGLERGWLSFSVKKVGTQRQPTLIGPSRRSRNWTGS